MPDGAERLVVAADVGGTFTDVVIASAERVEAVKVPSTPSDPGVGVIAGIHAGLQRLGAAPERVTLVTHATTVATNALLEHRGASVGLLVTDGHRDLLEIARQRRLNPLDLRAGKPEPLVPRGAIAEIGERLGADGDVVVALDDEDVRAAFARLDELGVDAFAISFLHGFQHTDHERRAAGLLRELAGERPVFASHEVVPQAREYERTSTTVIAAYLAPAVSGYLERLGERLDELGAPSAFLVMKSNGGLASAELAARHPEELVESGPAAGVVGAARSGAEVGHRDLISFDMGGTTAKGALILDGAPRLSFEYEVGGDAHAGDFLQRGTGYPLRVPVVDLAEVGTGGGSIAWVDGAGALRLGPRSAGAEPGPACYGRGGEQPTVTDADLVLGLIRADGPSALGRLDEAAARRALAVHVAEPLGMTVEEAARGVFALATAQMADAVRLVSVARGHDARDFAMVPFGGAGPVHAWAIARHLGIRTLLAPPLPGVFSAVGLLKADVRVDVSQGVRLTGDDAAMRAGELLDALAARAGEELGRPVESLGYAADLRYRGQSYELTVEVPHEPGRPADLGAFAERFHAGHRRAYGHARPEHAVELAALRASATGSNGVADSLSGGLERRSTAGAGAADGERPVDFGAGPVACAVIRRGDCDESWRDGPLAIEQDDTTVVVPPDARVRRVANGHLEIEL